MEASASFGEGRRSRPRLDETTVALLHVYADFEDATQRAEYSEQLSLAVRDSYDLIAAELRDSIARRLGPEFELRSLEVVPGSVELLALIGFVGSAVMTYGAVREGLHYLLEDGRFIVQRVLQANLPQAFAIAVATYLNLGPAMEKFQGGLSASGVTRASAALLSPAYFVAVITLVILLLLGTLMTVVLVKVL